MSELHQRIRLRREALGMTQEQLASKLNYKSRSSINKIEMGQNDIPQAKIQAFADALHTTPAYLMGWTNEQEQPQSPSRYPRLQKDHSADMGELKQQPHFCGIQRRESDGHVLFPVLSGVAGIVQGKLVEVLSGQTFGIYWDKGDADPNHFFVWCVKDESMSPLFWKGDHLLVQRKETVKPGEYALFYNGQCVLLRKVSRCGGEQVVMQPLNGSYASEALPREQVHILGRAVFLCRHVPISTS